MHKATGPARSSPNNFAEVWPLVIEIAGFTGASFRLLMEGSQQSAKKTYTDRNGSTESRATGSEVTVVQAFGDATEDLQRWLFDPERAKVTITLRSGELKSSSPTDLTYDKWITIEISGFSQQSPIKSIISGTIIGPIKIPGEALGRKTQIEATIKIEQIDVPTDTLTLLAVPIDDYIVGRNQLIATVSD